MQILKRNKYYVLFFIISLLITLGFNMWLDPPGSFPKENVLDYLSIVIGLVVLTVFSFVLMVGRIVFDVLKNRKNKEKLNNL